MGQNEAHHLQVIYQRLTRDIDRLTTQLADLAQSARSLKQQLSSDGHLDLGTFSDQLESFASIEANNRQIDTLNARHDTAVTRLNHAKLLLPQAYFAKLNLDFGDDDREELYLGKVGYTDENTQDLVYDWRSPVADAYYANRTGATTYRANGHDIPVTIQQRQQFVIDHDHLLQVVDTDAAIGDPLLLEVLASNRSGGLQEITATIQQEQNAIIRESRHPIVIVDGVAGSGKTSVLLQRVAYQLYRHRDSWSPADILILTPNTAFSRYIRGVLPALGEAEPLSTTYLKLIQSWGQRFGLTISNTTDNHLVELAARLRQPYPQTPAGLSQRAYNQSNNRDSLLIRMQTAWRWLTAVNLAPEELGDWLDWDQFGRDLGSIPLTAYDRLYLLLNFTAYQQTVTQALFIDEAQDYSSDTWLFLATLFRKTAITIVGDHRQRLSGQATTISDFFDPDKTAHLRLTTSYRATGQITRFFGQFAGDWQDKISAVQKEGTAPQIGKTNALSHVLAKQSLSATQSLGIITPTAEIAARLATQYPEGQLLEAQTRRTVRPGINILPLALAKGLEFDFAVVTHWQSAFYTDQQHGNNRRYVAASRGTKGLTLLN